MRTRTTQRKPARGSQRLTGGVLGMLIAIGGLALAAKGCRSGPVTPRLDSDRSAAAAPIVIRDRRGLTLAQVDPESGDLVGHAPEYARRAVAQIRSRFGAALLRVPGLRIDTPFDSRLQGRARATLRQHLLPNEGRGDGPSGQGVLVALEADSRQVLVMTSLTGGGHAGPEAEVSRSRPAGTTLKPFLAAAALRAGSWSPQTPRIETRPATQPGLRPWQPQGVEGFRPVTLRVALRGSTSTPMVRAAADLEPELLRRTFRGFGLPPDIAALDAATGRAQVPPLALANAYATLAAEGLAADPSFVTTLGIPDDGAQGLRADGQRVALMPAQARLLARLLRGGSPAASPLRAWPGAVTKRSTSPDGRAAWFVGYAQNLVVAVWLRLPAPPAGPGARDAGAVAQSVWMDFVSQARWIS